MREYFHIHFTGMDYSETKKAQAAIDCKKGWKCKTVTGGAENGDITPKEGSWNLKCTDKIILSDEQTKFLLNIKNVLDRFLEKVKVKDLLVETASTGRSSLQDVGNLRLSTKGKDGMDYALVDGSDRFDGYVGLLSGDVLLKNQNIEVGFHVTLQIQSRMDICGKDGKPGRPYFLSTLLLGEVTGLNGDEHIPGSEDEIFDFLLLFWFREQFREASRKGFYRTYQRFEKNDDRLRESIDFPEHLRLNLGLDNGRIAYSYRENTVNNPVNHLLVAAYDVLKRKYSGFVSEYFDADPDLKSDIEYLRCRIEYGKHGISELISMNLNPIGHPYYTEYERLRRTCLQILRDEEISAFDSRLGEEVNGVLIYLPDLWENFLEHQIMKQSGGVVGKPGKEPGMEQGEKSGGDCSEAKITLKSQVKIPVFEKKVWNQSRFVQETYPDYVFYDEGRPFMILDAKFKPKWEAAAFGEGSISDVLEDYNKCLRDMVSVNAHAAGVIFPVSSDAGENKELFRHAASEYNQTDIFYTFPVRIPFAPRKGGNDGKASLKAYSAWKKELDENLNRVVPLLWQYVKEERNRAQE